MILSDRQPNKWVYVMVPQCADTLDLEILKTNIPPTQILRHSLIIDELGILYVLLGNIFLIAFVMTNSRIFGSLDIIIVCF